MPRHCCVIGCCSNYRRKNQKYLKSDHISTFSLFKECKGNDEKLQNWLRRIARPRDNFPLNINTAICIEHFAEEFIIRVDTATRPDGSVLSVRRKFPKLSRDAYPSIFPPSEPVVKRRKPEDRHSETKTGDEQTLQQWLDRDRVSLFDELCINSTKHNLQSPLWNFQTPTSSTDTMWCSAINCTNSRKKKPQLSFFRFPKDEERCRQWVQLCRRQDLVDKSTAYVSENCRLCANHFEETQFMNYQKRDSLVWNAVPTLFHFSSPPKRLKFRCRPPLPRKQDLMMSKTGKRPRVVAQKQKKQIAEDLYACTSTAPTSEQPHSSDSDHSTSTEAKRAKISVTESPSNVATRMPSNETVKSTMTTFSREPVAISTDSMLRITSPKVPMVDADEMVNICAGLNCRNTRQKCPGMKFLRFPKDQARSNVWVQHTRRLDLRGKSAEYLHRTAVLCETHFDDDQWMDKDEKSLGLIPKAVPTLFDVPFPPLRMTVKRKLPRRRFADDQTEIGDMEHDHCYASSVDHADATDQTDASCCVLNCPNEAKTGLRLYPFPADKTKFRKWIAYCGREPGWTPDIHSRLCELHFEDNQFIGGGGGGGDEGNEGRPLKAEAIPNRHYLSIPLTTGRKLRLLLDHAASQDKFVHSIRNYSGDSEITSCPELPDHSGTVENATQERLKMSKKGASESIIELSSIEKTELAIDLCKNLIAEMLLSSAELFLERVELISHLRDAWADGRSVSLLLADANRGTDMEAKTCDAETETIFINKSRNNRSEGSGIGQADICDQESTERTKQAQADEQDLYLNIECDVITEDSDCDTRMKQSDDICDEVVEKYEQASIDFGKYVARVLQRHDCNCPMKPKDLTELVGIVRKKFMTMELQLKRQTTEAVAALQSLALNDRYKESSSTNSTSKMLGNFFNSFDGYWPPVPAKNVKRSDKNLVTKESPSTVPGVIKVSVGDASHRSNEGKGQETIEKPKSIHGKKAGLVNVPQIFTASGDAVLYQCIDCKQIFIDKVSCQVHAETGCKPVRGRQSVSKTKGGLIYECPHCHKTFPFFSKMIEHLPVHTKPFLCHSCGQRFAQEDMLTEHKSTCTAASAKTDSTKKSSKSTGPVLCSTCGKQFLRKSSLYYHMRRHIGKPHHMCSFCGKLFYVNAVLVQHLRTHTGEKPYLCPQCPLRFVTTGLLQRHLRVHTGEKPYTCDVCQRTFAQSNSLKTHRLTHSTEKPHSCMHCERAFRKRSSLIMHMRAHTKDRRPLTCKTCGKVFSSRARLATHEVIHTGRRPAKNYECSKCQKKFDTDRGLERHVTVVHSGQTPNKAVACNICHQRFFTTARLERHKELHHGKESSKNEAAMKGDSMKNSVKGDTTTRVGDLVLQTLSVPN